MAQNSKNEDEPITKLDEIFDEAVENRDPLEMYRIGEYIHMGFTDEQAESLARVRSLSSADIREKFIKRGCSTELAYRILCPT